MWFLFALLSALIYALRGVLEKRVLGHTDQFILGAGIRLYALPFFFAPFLIKPDLFINPLDLPWKFWLAVVVVSLVSTPIETLFYYRALKKEEASFIIPLLGLIPVITTLLALVVLKEHLSLLGLVGILMVVFGVYVLKIGHAKDGLLSPLKHLVGNPAVQMMSVVVMLQAVSWLLDKMGIVHANIFMYALANYCLVSIVLIIIAKIYAPDSMSQLVSKRKPLSVLGTVVASYTLLNFAALSIGNVGYVSAVRSSSAFFAIVFGLLFLKEKDLRAKLLAGMIIVCGLLLIKLFGH